MGVAAHLGIDLRDYDARIRTFIPDYEEMLRVAASMVGLAGSSPLLVDLGIGTGGLAARALAVAPRARIVGIDSDPDILAVAKRRLGARLTTVVGDLERVIGGVVRESRGIGVVHPANAIMASFALHHVRTRHRKAALYMRAFAALQAGGLLINADCCLSSDPRLRRADRLGWRRHLERTYTRAKSEAFLRTWGTEDVYFTLNDEVGWMQSAGFQTDVIWRRGAFAVVVGIKR